MYVYIYINNLDLYMHVYIYHLDLGVSRGVDERNQKYILCIYIYIIPLGLGVSRGVDERDQKFDHLPQLHVSVCTIVPVKQVN
jgi:hypothetical protein